MAHGATVSDKTGRILACDRGRWHSPESAGTTPLLYRGVQATGPECNRRACRCGMIACVAYAHAVDRELTIANTREQ